MRTLTKMLILVVLISGSSGLSILATLGLETNTTELNQIKGFSSNILLSTLDTKYPEHVEPTLTIGHSDEIFVGWKEALQPTSAGVDVSFTKSGDQGKTWSEPVSMPNNVRNGASKSDPWLYAYGDQIYYSYLEYSNTTDPNQFSQITMARSNDGITWQTSKASNNKQFADKETFIISPEGEIFLFYDDINIQSGLGVVSMSKSTDGGKTFPYEVQVSDVSNDDILSPYSALSSNNSLFVAWLKVTDSININGDVFYDSSSNKGVSFHIDKDLNQESEYGAYGNENLPWKFTMPVIKFDSHDRLYILWNELQTTWKLYLRYSDDFGGSWSSKIPININPNTHQWQGDMDIDGNDTLHIAWLEEENGQYRPYYRSFSFTGDNRFTMQESAIIPIADKFTPVSFIRPGDYLTIRADSNNIPHVVWTDGRSRNLDIYYSNGLQDSLSPTNTPGYSYVVLVIALFIGLKKKRDKKII